LRELTNPGQESRLADTRLALDHDHATTAVDRVSKRGDDSRDLGVPLEERRSAHRSSLTGISAHALGAHGEHTRRDRVPGSAADLARVERNPAAPVG
jgi:hypothetical protein